jgi:hypothetical protein
MASMTAFLYILLWLFSLMAGCTSPVTQAAAVKTERMSKIGPELVALYNEYSAHSASSSTRGFQPSSPLVRLIADRVVIDAVASGDVDTLKSDLLSLGMQEAVSAGRIVSGQLPVSAIPKMAQLSSLHFVNAAAGFVQGGGGSITP